MDVNSVATHIDNINPHPCRIDECVVKPFLGLCSLGVGLEADESKPSRRTVLLQRDFDVGDGPTWTLLLSKMFFQTRGVNIRWQVFDNKAGHGAFSDGWMKRGRKLTKEKEEKKRKVIPMGVGIL